MLACLPAQASAQESAGSLNLHVVATPIRSYRLLSMSMDDDGYIWAGAIHQVIHRYDPRTGTVLENVRLPHHATASSCICVGKKVYVLGQSYPRLVVYNRTTRQFREVDYTSSRPNVWYGTGAGDGRHLYLFDRGLGVIKWDTQVDTGKPIAYPYGPHVPGGGYFESSDRAVWCTSNDGSRGQYKPIGLARIDVAADQFTGFYAFPKDDAGLKPYANPATTLFLPLSLKGKLAPFDFHDKRWCKFLDVPHFGERFGFIGGPNVHAGRSYFSLSTYNGTPIGCDGKPYHFCNGLLEFDPQTRRFAFPTLEAKDAYFQIAYVLSAGGHFYATGTNIREPDGRLNGDRAGEVVFWQTRPLERK
jgi:hypothetical protein